MARLGMCAGTRDSERDYLENVNKTNVLKCHGLDPHRMLEPLVPRAADIYPPCWADIYPPCGIELFLSAVELPRPLVDMSKPPYLSVGGKCFP